MNNKADSTKRHGLGWILASLLPRQKKRSLASQTQPEPGPPSAKSAKERLSNVVSSTQEQPASPTPEPASKEPAGGTAVSTATRLKLAPAFFNLAAALSFLVNILLMILLLSLGRELLSLKALLGNHLLGGLYGNFILMDQAHIKTNITVIDQIPVEFSLPISQDTVVTLTEATRINGAQVALNSGGVVINAPANIILPAGSNLPVHLELNVPVKTSIPITLNVPVDIPLADTDLHQPFIGLQQVVNPLFFLLQPQIQAPADLPCGSLKPICAWYFRQP
jgi:hypothetical protein